MSNNNVSLYLGVVHDLGDSQIRVSVEKSFHRGREVSTSRSLGRGCRKKRRVNLNRRELFTKLTSKWMKRFDLKVNIFQSSEEKPTKININNVIRLRHSDKTLWLFTNSCKWVYGGSNLRCMGLVWRVWDTAASPWGGSRASTGQTTGNRKIVAWGWSLHQLVEHSIITIDMRVAYFKMMLQQRVVWSLAQSSMSLC